MNMEGFTFQRCIICQNFINVYPNDHREYQIECTGGCGFMMVGYPTEDDAINAWNTQVSKVHNRITRLRTALSRAGIIMQSLQNTVDDAWPFGRLGPDERKAFAWIQTEIKKALEETK